MGTDLKHGLSGSGLASSSIAISRVPPTELARLVVLLVGAIVVSLAGLLGGMQYVIIGLALGLAILVVRKPEEGVPAGLLFMLAAMTLLPSYSRFHYIDGRTAGIDWQMYYWAAGSLIVALAGLYSVGFSSLLRAPFPLLAFLVVALASSLFGFFRGNEISYVIRQLYGSVLFVVYFVIARSAGNEELLFRRLKVLGSLLAFAFVVYYVSVFNEWGFHKEDTSVPVQMGIFASLLFVKGLIEKRLSWIASSGGLFIASFLLFMRHVLLAFFFAAALTLAMQNISRIRKALFFAVALVILLPSVFPLGAQFAADMLEEKAPGIYDLLPEGTHNAKTLMDRTIQIAAGAALLLHSPVFGGGMGAELTWSSDLGERDEKFVDNGWAYLAVKMGCAGILTFGWLLVSILRCMSRRSLTLSISLLAILLIVMFSEPVCFQFALSPIPAALAGILYARKHPLVSHAAASSAGLGPGPQAA